MNQSKFVTALILIVLFASFATATCTVTLDKESYVGGETATATIICNAGNEKSQDFTLAWGNGTTVLESDIGTTPSILSQAFFESFLIPGGISWTSANATLTGTNLEGFDTFNVSSVASANSLIIKNLTFSSPLFIGKNMGVKAVVEDENGKLISNANCQVDIEDGLGLPIIAKKEVSYFGNVQVNFILASNTFNEDRQYLARFSCFCGLGSTEESCIDSSGNEVNNSVGTSTNIFTTAKWLTVNTVTDKRTYIMKNEIFICVNVTNIEYDKRINMPIEYVARCSASEDNNNDRDRILILSQPSSDLENRGISSNTTQMQCKRFIIPEAKFLQGRDSECYASTEVYVNDDLGYNLISYHTTSPVFNVTSSELNIVADWQITNTTHFYSTINLSAEKYADYNGTGIGDIDIKLHSRDNSISSYQSLIEGVNINEFVNANNVKNATIYNKTGGLVTWGLEILEDGSIELELRGVDITRDAYYNISMELQNFNNRQTQALESSATALEGIENKTGTFHLSVECPNQVAAGENITCSLSAQVEDSQIVQKEVDFTCYLSDGVSTYNSLNFNQMINHSLYSVNKTISVPITFSGTQSYLFKCEAHYYNLGSREDIFYDSFITNLGSPSTTSGSRSGYPYTNKTFVDGSENDFNGEQSEHEKSKGNLITGGAVYNNKNSNILNWFNPMSEERDWFMISFEIIFLLGVMVLIYTLIKNNDKKVSKKISALLFIMILFVLLIAGIWHGYNIIKKDSQTSDQKITNDLNITQNGSYLVLKGNLSQSIFMIFMAVLTLSFMIIIFTAILISILFKMLNINGEIKFGKKGKKKRASL